MSREERQCTVHVKCGWKDLGPKSVSFEVLVTHEGRTVFNALLSPEALLPMLRSSSTVILAAKHPPGLVRVTGVDQEAHFALDVARLDSGDTICTVRFTADQFAQALAGFHLTDCAASIPAQHPTDDSF